MKKADAILIGALLLAACGLFLLLRGGGEGGTAKVCRGGETVWVCPMGGEGSFETEGVCIRVSDGKAWVERSDCPDKSCTRCRPIRGAGESIVCLPNRVTVTIEGEGALDAVID